MTEKMDSTDRILNIALLILTIVAVCLLVYHIKQKMSGLETLGQLSSINGSVSQFTKKYGYLPGDLPNAEKILPDCAGCNPPAETAGDGIIGEADFIHTLRHHTPVKPNDEPELFWRHLHAAGFEADRERFDGQFVVGYADGTQLPKAIGFAAPEKGRIFVLMSNEALAGAPLNARGKQIVTPLQAFRTDCSSKCDDHSPDTGWIQAYGAPQCFTEKHDVDKNPAGYKYSTSPKSQHDYNVTWSEGESENDSKDCGLIFGPFNDGYFTKSEKEFSATTGVKQK